MQDGIFSYALLAILAIGLLIAAFTDLRSRQIGNKLNAAIAIGAPFFWFATGFSLGEVGIQLALAAGAFVVLAGLFALGAMGGGDVKLLTALALWVKPFWFLKLLVIMAIAGGILTLVLGAWHVMRRRKHKIAIPYGVAISFASLWVLANDCFPAIQSGALNG